LRGDERATGLLRGNDIGNDGLAALQKKKAPARCRYR